MKISGVLLLAVLSLATQTQSQEYEAYSKAISEYASPTVYIETSSGHAGTGCLIGFKDDSVSYLVTNRHVIEGASYLTLRIQLENEASVVTDSMLVKLPLIAPNSSRTFVVPSDTTLDVAVVPFLIGRIDASKGTVWVRHTPINAATAPRDLYAGERVVFFGFPLRLNVNGTNPLLRTGVVAGVDTVLNLVYLDAQAFNGSSGSPVFVAPWPLKKAPNFVGLIVGYVPLDKTLINPQTKRVEMIQYENSGIARVLPAWEVRKLAIQARKLIGH